MEGVIKFLQGDRIVYQKIYRSIQHRELIIKTYYEREDFERYDNIVIVPETKFMQMKDIIDHLIYHSAYKNPTEYNNDKLLTHGIAL